MKRKHWFLDRVNGHPPQREQTMHIVYGDGRVETIKAFAVVVTNGDVGLMMQPRPTKKSDRSASAILVAVDDAAFPDAQLVIEPGSANVCFINSRAS